jgi:CrcB protein
LQLPDTAEGNLAANIIGCALAAHLLVLMERRGITELRWFLLPGFCAGLTTFSGVTFETMVKEGSGFSYLLINVIASLAAAAIVLPLSRKWIKVR